MAVEKPQWMSIKDAAEYLSVGEPTICRWMREGRITFRKVGDSTRFFQADLDAMIEVHPSEKDAEIVKEFCPVCHHGELVPGRMQSTGLLYFRPQKTKFWTFLEANVPVQGKMCPQCGAVTLFGDAGKLNKLRDARPGDVDPIDKNEQTSENATP